MTDLRAHARAAAGRYARVVLVPLVAVGLGLAAGIGLVAAAGGTPAGAFRVLWNTSVACSGSGCGFFVTLGTATPLILTTMAAVVCFRSGLFSIGQEGQYVLGALAAAFVGYAVDLAGPLHVLACVAAAVLAGALYGFVPGVLRAHLGVNELIATIILNNIAVMLASYLVNYPLRADRSSQAYTPTIAGSAFLPAFVPTASFGVGFVVAVTGVLAVRWFLMSTTAGYAQRMAGQAPAFARYAGIPAKRAAVRAMTISGGLAGLAGAVQVLGVTHRFIDGFGDGTGLNGVTAALLAGFAPVGAALVAVLVAALSVGSLGLQIDIGVPSEVGGTITALLILLVAGQAVIERGWQRTAAWLRRRSLGPTPSVDVPTAASLSTLADGDPPGAIDDPGDHPARPVPATSGPAGEEIDDVRR